MAAIFATEVWCDDCADAIKSRFAADWFEDISRDGTPDGADFDEPFESVDDLDDYLRGMDERYYDSDSYPKYCSDDQECDCPQHCAAGAECLNYSETSDGERYGMFFGNALTSDGDEYVKDAVRADRAEGHNGSPACELWAPCYDYIDFDECEDCADNDE
jgi:hypothetical protein